MMTSAWNNEVFVRMRYALLQQPWNW